MTQRLYYTDAFLTRFRARVLARETDGTRVYLERTAFYPTSGGQPHDLGRLGGVAVIDVIDEDDRIAHLLAAPLPTGDEVEGELDWPRRWDLMQQHTAQHLLTAVLARLTGRQTVSVHFGAGTSTLDLDGPVSSEQIRTAEQVANQEITANHEVTISFEDAATATGLRKAPDRRGEIRIVTIDTLDRSACGGTHVRRSGELGALLIRKAEKVKQLTRLEFLAGGRAVSAARGDFERLHAMAVSASTAIEEVPALFEKLRTELKAGDGVRRGLETELNRYRASELYHAAVPDANGVRVIEVTGDSVEAVRGLAQAAIALPRVLLVGSLAAPPTIVVATSADSGLDANGLLRAPLAAAGGRGGGNARLAQGTVPALESVAVVVRQITGASPSA